MSPVPSVEALSEMISSKSVIALAEQGLERLGDVLLAVVDRKADGEPGCRAHLPPTLRPAAGRNGMTTARAERRPSAAGSHISPPDSEGKLGGAAESRPHQRIRYSMRVIPLRQTLLLWPGIGWRHR